MRAVLATLNTGSQAVSMVLAAIVVALAVAMAAAAVPPSDIAAWGRKVLGPTFLGLLAALVTLSLFSWLKLLRQPGDMLWVEAGLQAAGGITTLALTYTLLGISLGIGTLAERDLSPQTVQVIVRELTADFSLAFMTTVIGLPISAVLRALLMVTHARHQRHGPTVSPTIMEVER